MINKKEVLEFITEVVQNAKGSTLVNSDNKELFGKIELNFANGELRAYKVETSHKV